MKTNPKILIVDDDPVWQETLSVYLELEFGWPAILLPTGQDVLNFIEKEPVDVVITDTNMPLIHGLSLLAVIKATCPETKVIVFFNGLNGSDITKEQVIKMGADGVLRKEETSLLLSDLLKR